MHKLTTLSELIVDWNTKVNIISRNPPPTPSHVMERHIAPSVALLSMMPRNVKSVVDVGTGGGFPGLPLALCMAETDFVLCDSVGKVRRCKEQKWGMKRGAKRGAKQRPEHTIMYSNVIASA